jgi:hypothetical protein
MFEVVVAVALHKPELGDAGDHGTEGIGGH